MISIQWDGTFSFGDAVTAASILAAGAGFLVNSWRLQQQERRQNTFQLLSRIFEPGPVAEARIQMAQWIAAGRRIENDNLANEQDERVMLCLIDFYEFVCEGALRGVVDQKLLDQEAGGRIERAFFVVRSYIFARERRLTELNKREGLGPVILYRHMRRFLAKRRGIDAGLKT